MKEGEKLLIEDFSSKVYGTINNNSLIDVIDSNMQYTGIIKGKIVTLIGKSSSIKNNCKIKGGIYIGRKKESSKRD